MQSLDEFSLPFRLGRRKSLVVLQVIAGSCTIACAQILDNKLLGTTQVALTTVAKFCSSMAFTLIYIFVAEMYPTNLRSTAIGACSTTSRYIPKLVAPLKRLLLTVRILAYVIPLPSCVGTTLGSRIKVLVLLLIFCPQLPRDFLIMDSTFIIFGSKYLGDFYLVRYFNTFLLYLSTIHS